MREQDDKLTLQETEQLCRLYVDCRLSVLDEAELRYFLTQADYHSPLIDEVRQIMDIDTYISDKPFVKTGYGRKPASLKWRLFMGIAASIAIIIVMGLSFRLVSSHSSVESQSYFIAYVDGQRMSDEAARLQIEAEKRSIDEFIKEMSELEASKQQMIDNFINP